MTDLQFRRLTATQARDHRDIVEDIYRRSYSAAIDSGDPFDSPATFMHRFDAYTSPTRDSEFELVMALLDGVPVGQTWGWPLTRNTPWWNGLTLDESNLDFDTREDGTRTFGLSEIMVDQTCTGRGIARALHDKLLTGRPESRATLLVEPENTRAYSAYRKWGWTRIGTLTPSWDNAPTFDVLIYSLR